MTTAPVPSWKNPKPLRNALADWASRDDTRPDPVARAAANAALAAIADTIAELAALGLRLEREIADSEYVHAEITGDDGTCPADGCVLPGGHFPRVQHVDSGGVIFGTYLKLADDDSGYRDAAELDHDEQIAVALAADEGPLSGPQLAVVQSAAGLVHDEPAEDGAASAETFPCDCGGRLLWPLKGGPHITCMKCGAVWEHDGADIGGGARMKAAGTLDTVDYLGGFRFPGVAVVPAAAFAQ